MEKFDMTTDCNKRGNATEIRESILMGIKSVIDKCMDILNKIPDGCEYDGLIDDVADELCDFRESHVKKALSDISKNKEPEVPTIKFFKFDERAKIPIRSRPTDSGMNIYSREYVTLAPNRAATIRTGIGAIIPSGYELQVRPRSDLSGIGKLVAFGTIDEWYRSEIRVTILNLTIESSFLIYPGDVIAQLVLVPVTRPIIEICEKPNEETHNK